jgi:Zn-dependent M28 family amino/carboxypeptidase
MENERTALYLAARLAALGARPVVGTNLLVPFSATPRPSQVVHNVVGVLPARNGSTDGPRIGITSHFDHIGVDTPDARGDSIYNGFLDAALPVAIVLDVARRYAASPGDKPLVVAFFNLEEEGLLGSLALARRGPQPIGDLKLLIGVDAGSPAGEAIEWQLMGGTPAHFGARIADSLARARGWTTTSTPPRGISDVFAFSQIGVPILFPIPGRTWRGYTDAERSAAMARFDHYHQPSDEPSRAFPLVGTWHFADWLWSMVSVTARNP